MRALRWIAEAHEAKQRRRHAVRRRERARGYLPVHDEQYEPLYVGKVYDEKWVYSDAERRIG